MASVIQHNFHIHKQLECVKTSYLPRKLKVSVDQQQFNDYYLTVSIESEKKMEKKHKKSYVDCSMHSAHCLVLASTLNRVNIKVV